MDSNLETGTRSECLTQLRKKRLKAVKGPEKMYLGVERTGGAQITRRKVGILGRVEPKDKGTENVAWVSDSFVSQDTECQKPGLT